VANYQVVSERAYARTDERSVVSVLAEIKDEVKEFVRTRISMLQSEMKDNLSALKMAVPMIGAALLFGMTAWFLLTAALVAIIGNAFLPNGLAYFFALIIVGVAYLLIGAILGSFAFRELKKRGFKPERTIKVLKEDQVWFQTEARQQT
jgi:uncharacterized membrane protein YqjE